MDGVAQEAGLNAVGDRTAEWTAHGPAGGDYRWRTQVGEAGDRAVFTW